MWNYRQKLQLLIIIFFIFVTFAAADEAWMPWVRSALLCSLSLSRLLSQTHVVVALFFFRLRS